MRQWSLIRSLEKDELRAATAHPSPEREDHLRVITHVHRVLS